MAPPRIARPQLGENREEFVAVSANGAKTEAFGIERRRDRTGGARRRVVEMDLAVGGERAHDHRWCGFTVLDGPWAQHREELADGSPQCRTDRQTTDETGTRERAHCEPEGRKHAPRHASSPSTAIGTRQNGPSSAFLRLPRIFCPQYQVPPIGRGAFEEKLENSTVTENLRHHQLHLRLAGNFAGVHGP